MLTHADITMKFKIAAVKPGIHVSTFVHGISMLLYMITTKVQRLYTYVLVRQHGETRGSTVRRMGMS